MNKHLILEEPSSKRRDEFLAAVARSRKLHRHWARPPRTTKEFRDSLRRLQSGAHLTYWICTEDDELAGVININEIVRGVFCSGYLGYYAFVPHNGCGYMKKGFALFWKRHFDGSGYIGLRRTFNPIMKRLANLFNDLDFDLKDSRPDI